MEEITESNDDDGGALAIERLLGQRDNGDRSSGPLTQILETERLKLREFSQDDLDDLAAMVADEDQVTFYFCTKTRDKASAWLCRNLDLYAQHGFGSWLIESRATSGFLGYCGIRPWPSRALRR